MPVNQYEVRSVTGTPIVSDFAGVQGTPIVIDRSSGTAWVLTSADEVVMIGSGDMSLEASYTGKWRGKDAMVHIILGQRRLGWNSTTAMGDAAVYLDTSQDSINTVSTGTTYYLVSTSANDAAAGTGARTVQIVYLDSSGLEQTTTKTLTGTTPVNLGTGFSYFQYMEVVTAGSGGVSAGDISITSTNGAATVATTVERIRNGVNKSQCARYKVPSDCNAYLLNWDSHAINADMDARLRATVSCFDRSLISTFTLQDTMYLALNTNDDEDMEYLKCPAGAEIKISAVPSAAPSGNRLDCSIRLVCVKI